MPTRIGVAILHGVLVEDREFADAATRRLRAAFAREIAGADAEEVLVCEPVHWAPVLEARERDLLRRIWGEDRELFAKLRSSVLRVNRGDRRGLIPPVLRSLLPSSRAARQLNFGTLRWLMVHFAGDAIAYQQGPADREVYDQIHGVLAGVLRSLAGRLGGDAPLCIIAHSLGSVIASNYVYDLQEEQSGRSLLSDGLRDQMGDTPLERGETLSGFYTLGSPLALWSLRHDEFGRPIRLPRGEWLNLFDRDDVIAFPLRSLNAAYACAVKEDVEVRFGGLLSGWNPLVHTGYLTAEPVMRRLARSLGELWREIEGR